MSQIRFSVTNAMKSAMQMNGQEKLPKPPHGRTEPHLIHHSLGRPQLPSKMVARSLHSFYTTTSQNYYWLQWDAPYPPLKLPIPVAGTTLQHDDALHWGHLTHHPK